MKKGFSLLELILSTTILLFILVVMVPIYGKFSDNLEVSSAAQEMAVAIRQAQVYGTSVKEVSVGSGVFSAAYGIYFNPTSNSGDYYLFSDNNGDKKYTVGSGCGSGSTECIERVILRNGVTVSAVCDSGTCPGSPSGCNTSLHVTYKRPSTTSDINFANSSAVICSASQTTGKVRLVSKRGKTVDVTIEKTGQILVR